MQPGRICDSSHLKNDETQTIRVVAWEKLQ